MPHPPRSCDSLDDDHMTAEVHRRWGGGSSYPWSRFMAGCPILILMASLTFLFNQTSSLASTLTLSLVILWCSCAQCSPTAVSGFLRFFHPCSQRPACLTDVCEGVLAREDVWLKRKVREAIEIKIGQRAMKRPGVRAPPIYDELLLSCDRRQSYHMTSEGEALRPEEECAKHSKANH